jgi:chemotaxis regulatin CheY-phosphate phosphatase CheZ
MTLSKSLQEVIQNELASLTVSVNGLVENLHKMKSPLVESHDKVPQATNQLDKISAQTEAATNQMLDVIEHITQRDQQIITGLQHIGEEVSGQPAAAKVNELCELVNANMNDAYAVMDALQFQDITAQQMDHAASLLEEIEGKLEHILQSIGAQDANDGALSTRKIRTYDPHADLFERKTEQSVIDTIFDKTKK